MKKLVLVSSFIVLGVMAYAQAPAKSNATLNTKEVKATATAVAAPVAESVTVSDAVAPVAEVKKADKKECSTEEKKACGTKAEGKKSCCSSKAEAKKEDK